MQRAHVIALVLCAAFLAACGGGGGGGSSTPANPAQQPAAQKATAQFVIKVPPKPQSSARNPQYVSPSTMSLTITIDTQTPIVTNLTPSSPNCSGSGGTLTCTVTASVVAGTHTFVLTAYDAVNAGGNKLSTTTLAGQVIAAGQPNVVPVTLSGIPASIVLTLAQSQPAVGAAATIPLTVAAKDADGNTIIGAAAYVNAAGNPLTISLTDSDTSGATALSTTTVTSPATAVNVTYTGAAIGSAVFSAGAPGITTGNITPATLTPGGGAVSSGGAVAIAVVTIGATTYAFVPALTGLAEVTIASNGVLAGYKRQTLGRRTASSSGPPPGLTQPQLEAWWAAYIKAQAGRQQPATGSSPAANASAVPAATASPLAINPVPNECAATTISTGATLYCINYLDAHVDVVAVNSAGAMSLTTQYLTDAPGQDVGYSAGSCTICGIVYDTADSAVIMSTGFGYELYGATSNAHMKTIPAWSAENFGYNVATNQVWSPQYSGTQGRPLPSPAPPSGINSLDVIDVAGNALYTFKAPAPAPSSTPIVFQFPDAGAVDPTTGIAVAPEEFNASCGSGTSGYGLYLMSLSSNQLNVPAPGPTGLWPGEQYFSNATFNRQCIPEVNGAHDAALEITDVAIDAPDHLVFFAAEFGSGAIGVGQLPGAATSTPALSDFAFATLPNMPNGNTFYIPGDPHAVATATIGSKNYALTFDASLSYLAIIDIKALLAAPRSSPNLVDPAYDLVAHGIATYVGIPGGF